MNLTLIPSIIKNFFLILCSIYLYVKVLNIKLTSKTFSFSILFSLPITLVLCYIKLTIPFYTILIMTLFLSLYCCIIFKQPYPLSLCISIFSIGGSYALFALCTLLSSPISYIIFSLNLSSIITLLCTLFLIGFLQNILVYCLFHTKRLREGLPKITTIFLKDTSIFVGALLILFSSAFSINDSFNLIFDYLLITFIVALGIIIWLWWQKSIQTDYINKNNFQQIDILESKLQERDAELERLSKIIHKDNKLLAALELSTREILTDASSAKAEALLQELNRFSKERSETLQAYESGPAALPETGLFSVDTMIRYLHQRALKHRIDFQLSLEGEVAGITDVISEAELCTIIGDLGENAIIATRESETKNIRLFMERKTDGYTLYFYDSGEPFAKEVLESLGKKRYTTHAETGGSGIGLMTTSELVAKYHGAFYITDEEIPEPYTKCVVVILKERH